METYNYLLVWRDKLKSLLYNSAAIHLQSQGEDMPTDTFRQSQFLFQAAKLEAIIIERAFRLQNPTSEDHHYLS